jgi:hypothetical protein
MRARQRLTAHHVQLHNLLWMGNEMRCHPVLSGTDLQLLFCFKHKPQGMSSRVPGATRRQLLRRWPEQQ